MLVKNKRFLFLISAGLLGLFFAGYFFWTSVNNNYDKDNPAKIDSGIESKIKLGDCVFQIEVAKTKEEKRKGLSERKNLCNDCGMFFVFEESGKYGFWMKNMLFPIDLIWLRNGEVTGFKENFSEKSQKTIFPTIPVDSVLEINAGKIKKCEIEKGNKIKQVNIRELKNV